MTPNLTTRRFLEAFIEKGILFLLIFTPLAFGTVQSWSSAVMEITAFLVFGAWLLTIWHREDVTIVSEPFLWPVAVFVALVLFQLFPLPPAAIAVLSSATASVYQMFGGPEGRSLQTLSIYPAATQQELARILCYLAVFLVIVNHYRTRPQVRQLLHGIVSMGLFLAVFAIVQKGTWNGSIYWFYPVNYSAHVMGPYVNRNHFAGYMEMAIPIALGLLLYEMMRAERGSRPSTRTLPFLVISILAMAAALVGSLSRGGMLGFACSMVLFLFMIRSRRTLRKKSLVVMISLLVLVVIVAVSGWSRFEERIGELGDQPRIARLDVWSDALHLSRDFPVWGTGLGTFRDAFLRYQTRYSTLVFEHAENDYLELITDCGWAGFLLVMTAALQFLLRTGRLWRSRHGNFSKCMGSGAVASCTALAVHGLVDFNLRVPANALLLTVVAAVLYAVVAHDTVAERTVVHG